MFSQAGGVGGRAGAYQGTGQTGFNINANATPESTTGVNAGPSFYLNNGSAFTAKGIANTDLLGKGFQYPAPPVQNAAALRKSLNLPKDIGTFVFEVDCINVWNKVTFSNPASTFGNANFGQISSVSGTPGSRDFQFAGHINF